MMIKDFFPIKRTNNRLRLYQRHCLQETTNFAETSSTCDLVACYVLVQMKNPSNIQKPKQCLQEKTCKGNI